ncbi:MAG: FAD-binding protein, partial [Halalkalicoccus sp.]
QQAQVQVQQSAFSLTQATGNLWRAAAALSVASGTDPSVFEPGFDCHVPQPEDRYEWFHDDAFDDQPYARFGLAIDGELRPLDAEGEPEFPNLRAAGAVLGGCDTAREKSASGVSLSTGLVAGGNASEDLQ